MSDKLFNASIDSAATILHVRPLVGRSACADAMDGRLADANLTVDSCFDVYRALARTCKSPDGTLRALIVSLDALGTSELEFFSVVARARPNLPVYIYGETATAARRAGALASGASGEATDDVIDRLAGQRPIELGTPRQDVQPPEVVAESRMTAEESDDPMSDADESARHDDDDFGRAVQVPWLSRKDGPVRRQPQGPVRTEDSKCVDDGEEKRAAIGDLHEPLLTEEELQALIGDDALEFSTDPRDVSSNDPLDDGDHE